MPETSLRVLRAAVLSAALLGGGVLSAQPVAGGGQSLRENLEQAIEAPSGGQLRIVGLKATELPAVYEVELNTGEILYSDISGGYLFAGDMYAATPNGLVNLSEGTRRARTREKIGAVPASEMIIFSPESVRAAVAVFTDVDCTYCRALHRDLDELLALGVEIRYLAYPRGGELAGSYGKMVSVWCSDDRAGALTRAKNGGEPPERDCESPVLEHYVLGNELGISGTPALVLADGRIVPGYADSGRLAALLGLD